MPMILTELESHLSPGYHGKPGMGKSYAYKVVRQVKKRFGDAKHQLITLDEYAEFHSG